MKKINELIRQILYKIIKMLTPPGGGDEFSYIISNPSNKNYPYNYDITSRKLEEIARYKNNPYQYETIFQRLNKIIKNYDLLKLKQIVGVNFGINPFDLFVLKSFIEENSIKHVLEFGAGTSSRMLDKMHVKRTSFSLTSIYYDVKFEKLDIYVDYQKIRKFIKNNQVDMLLIDCEHSQRMAELIDKKFLLLLDYNQPIFIHDWMDYGKETYAEQAYYFKHLLDKYSVSWMTDLPDMYIEKLKRMNDQFDNEKIYKKLNIRRGHLPVRRCSVILTPKH